jgi:propionyl-CoA carboxylase beta chain
LTARERIELLCDRHSFEELIDGSGDASVVVGSGAVHGREVFIFAKDQTFLSGSMSAAHAKQIIDIQTRALAAKAPLIGLFDSAGLRLDDDLSPLQGYAAILRNHSQAQGVIPQIAVVMGPCIGADAFAARAMDMIFMVAETSALVVTGPEIANAFSDDVLTMEMLGGAKLQAQESGGADAIFDDDIRALAQLRRFIDFLPVQDKPWKTFDKDIRLERSLDTLVPDDSSGCYDVKEVMTNVLDEGDFFELREALAPNLVIGLGRMEGDTIGLVASQSSVLGGVLDCTALEKAERFLRFCGAFDIPVVTLIDAPGFLPGLDQEKAGMAAAGAKLISAYAKVRSAKITVVLGQAYGAAFTLLSFSDDLRLAWPSARIGMMKAEGATFTAYEALAQGVVDHVVVPRETRQHLLEFLAAFREKDHKHVR